MKLKQVILSVVLIGLLVGCSTFQTQKFCKDYEADYKQYVELIANGVIPQPEVIAAAKIAALMLEAYCNWKVEETRGFVMVPVFDSNGVKRVYPPK